MHLRTALGAAAIFLCLESPAFAGTTIGVTLGPVLGSHTTQTASDPLTGFPLPFLIATTGGNVVDGEVLLIPPLGPQLIASGSTTQFSLITFLARVRVSRSVRLGLGEAIVNQKTTGPGEVFAGGPIAANITQASRVTGTRFAISYSPVIRPRYEIETELVFTPSLHGTINTNAVLAPTSRQVTLEDEPERGSEIDARAVYRVKYRRSSLSFGLRYYNYIALYAFNNSLADRNIIVYPFIGYTVEIGPSTRSGR